VEVSEAKLVKGNSRGLAQGGAFFWIIQSYVLDTENFHQILRVDFN
jgi:hypothetical protein